ncbi:DUF3383 family protein [Cytobacillus oceanisediminis]|uniref:DUF3383 family protein n=1 Tax=Cytobacillus oceanisediminis TaxID=665099 RepID=UPI00203C9F7B|nr:DUF3383 family protein [Cytobacillus oceanisediminis]MCM3404907.1 DUF3383 domain-containing protein [Cytobacillus oceanisediminis]
MPLQDVTVTIDIKNPSALIGLGTPLILVNKSGGSPYKEYRDLEAIKVAFGEQSEGYEIAKKVFDQGDTRPEKIAIATYDTTAVEPITAASVLEEYFYSDWYFVMLDAGTVEDYKAISDVVEGHGLKMAAHVVDSVEDLALLKVKDYDRTFVFQHSQIEEMPHAALIGRIGSLPVGSVTWKFKTLKSVTPQDLTPPKLSDIHLNGGMAYVRKAGIDQTSEGKLVSGEYIDVIHGKDWVKLNIEQQVQLLFASNPKIPYTDSGIAQIEGAVRTVLEVAGQNGIIAEDDSGKYLYTITSQGRNESPATDRAERKYSGLYFDFELAGAIHEAKIKGEILV